MAYRKRGLIASWWHNLIRALVLVWVLNVMFCYSTIKVNWVYNERPKYQEPESFIDQLWNGTVKTTEQVVRLANAVKPLF